MMKYTMTLALLWIASFTLQAQYEQQIRRDAEKFNEAYLSGDYDTYVAFTIPTVVEMAGGAEQMKTLTATETEVQKKSGFAISTIVPETIGEVYEGDPNIYTVVTQQVVMVVGTEKFLRTTNYLAESANKGNTWKFLSLEAYDRATLADYVPGLPDALSIPAVEDAMMIRE